MCISYKIKKEPKNAYNIKLLLARRNYLTLKKVGIRYYFCKVKHIYLDSSSVKISLTT